MTMFVCRGIISVCFSAWCYGCLVLVLVTLLYSICFFCFGGQQKAGRMGLEFKLWENLGTKCMEGCVSGEFVVVWESDLAVIFFGLWVCNLFVSSWS